MNEPRRGPMSIASSAPSHGRGALGGFGRRHLVAGTWSPAPGRRPSAVRSPSSQTRRAARGASRAGRPSTFIGMGLIQGETFERGSCRGGNPLRSTTRHLPRRELHWPCVRRSRSSSTFSRERLTPSVRDRPSPMGVRRIHRLPRRVSWSDRHPPAVGPVRGCVAPPWTAHGIPRGSARRRRACR